MQTALHFAARDGNLDLVKDLVEGKNGQGSVEVDAVATCGRTALHTAAKWGRYEVAKYLVEAGININLLDDRGRTALDVASEEKTRVFLERSSQKELSRIADKKSQRRAQARTFAKERMEGNITEIEYEDALYRLEQDYAWNDTREAAAVKELEKAEGLAVETLEALERNLLERPKELQAEAYEKSMAALRKKQKEAVKAQLEKERMEEVQKAEERRAKEKRRAERREKKELRLSRTCVNCGQKYTNETNRDGLCVHKGKWSNWGIDKKGNKVEWQFFWTCCKSVAYEGPCNGFSICSRSDPHEESEADIARHQAKLLKKLSIAQQKRGH